PASGLVRYMWVGERSASKLSMPIALPGCRLVPGSANVGGTGQVETSAAPLNNALPRTAAAWSNDPFGGFGAFNESWYACSAGKFGLTMSHFDSICPTRCAAAIARED